MDKTFKQYLEDRIAELKEVADNNSQGYQENHEGARMEELEDVLQEYNNQCTQILEAVGMTQERINEIIDIYCNNLIDDWHDGKLNPREELEKAIIYGSKLGRSNKQGSIKFGEWIRKEIVEDVLRPYSRSNTWFHWSNEVTTEELYNEYTAQRGETSTEDSSSS